MAQSEENAAAADVSPAPEEEQESSSKNLGLLLDLELAVCVSFGKVQMPFHDVLKLSAGAILELNRSVDDPVEILVNERVIATGEVVVVNGNYGVRIQNIASRSERLRSADSVLLARGLAGNPGGAFPA